MAQSECTKVLGGGGEQKSAALSLRLAPCPHTDVHALLSVGIADTSAVHREDRVGCGDSPYSHPSLEKSVVVQLLHCGCQAFQALFFGGSSAAGVFATMEWREERRASPRRHSLE